MNLFRKLTFLATGATYFLIFIGGLVRVSGAGMGCPDWPKCFGKWIPPLSLQELPANIDPATFNITLAWIEYFNRIVGMTVGLIIASMAIMAIVKFRDKPKILWASIASAVLVAFQGWQGAMVVASELQPLVITIHLFIALIIVSLLLYVREQSFIESSSFTINDSPSIKKTRRLVGSLWLLAIIQIVLGSSVRGSLEKITLEFPLWSISNRLADVGPPNHIHMLFGLILLLMAIFVAVTVLKQKDKFLSFVKTRALMVSLLILVQIILGLILMMVEFSPLIQLFHLWTASIFVGVLMLLYIGMGYSGKVSEEHQVSNIVYAVASFVFVAILAFGAYGVVDRAEKSRVADLAMLKQIPEFSFVDRDGQPFGTEQMKGKLNIVDFFFSRCHGPCPVMVVKMHELYTEFKHSDKVQIVSISVDPEHDRPDVLTKYAEDHGVTDKNWRFATGDMESTVKLCEEGFLVSGDLPGMHSTKFMIVDDNGWIRGYYSHDDDASLNKLRIHIIELARDMP